VSELFTIKLTLLAPVVALLKFEDVLGKPTVVAIDQNKETTRHINGIITRFRQDHRDNEFARNQAIRSECWVGGVTPDAS
jgi:uncharacterized protein involved in type VI secretion and phage assembly